MRKGLRFLSLRNWRQAGAGEWTSSSLREKPCLCSFSTSTLLVVSVSLVQNFNFTPA